MKKLTALLAILWASQSLAQFAVPLPTPIGVDKIPKSVICDKVQRNWYELTMMSADTSQFIHDKQIAECASDKKTALNVVDSILSDCLGKCGLHQPADVSLGQFISTTESKKKKCAGDCATYYNIQFSVLTGYDVEEQSCNSNQSKAGDTQTSGIRVN
jgi:hypothetical protein